MTSIAQKIAIRNAIAARAANPEAKSAPARKKGFDLEAIAAGEASRSTMKRFLKSIEGLDDAALSVEQSRAAAYAEQATAPNVRDATPFRTTLTFDSVESKITADGKMTNYLVMRGCEMALLQTWGTAARRHPVGGLGSIGEMLIEHNHGFGQGRGSNSECSFNQAHLPHDTWLQAPCLGLSFA